ncbi:SDR family oxidoreductase [Modestobacter sp. DSM 44400]|nr:SDR family oxidoreductase [Modestobacter sp. DSM 44400]
MSGPSSDLTGKTALITGATSRIGRATAQAAGTRSGDSRLGVPA